MHRAGYEWGVIRLLRATRKLANCDTVEEYYRKSSCAPFLKGIKVPLVCINSADDPIVPPPLLEVIKKAASMLY